MKKGTGKHPRGLESVPALVRFPPGGKVLGTGLINRNILGAKIKAGVISILRNPGH